MAPPYRDAPDLEAIRRSNPKMSAVLLLLYEHHDQPHVAMIRRADARGVHAGQIGFPGGRREPVDTGPEYTALRETREEIGVAEDTVRVLGRLSPLYVPPSHFWIDPFVGWVAERPRFIPEPGEVSEVLEVPVTDWLSVPDGVPSRVHIPRLDVHLDVPGYPLGRDVVWGASAMILAEFFHILNHTP